MLGILRHRDIAPPSGVLQIGTVGNLIYQHPINYGDNYGKNAYIFTAAELGTAKTITALEFYIRSFSPPLSYTSQKIKMGLVTQSAFPSATPNMDFTDLTLTGFVTAKNTFTFSITSNGIWYTLTLDTPFVYDGVKNLLVVWENNMGSWMSQTGGTSYLAVTNTVAAKNSATSPVTGNGTRSSNRPVIKIHY